MVIGGVLSLLSWPTFADLATPVVNPAQPRAGVPVTVTVQGGGCAVLLSDYDARVEISGNQISLYAPGFESQFGGVFCAEPPWHRTFSLGVLPVGSYDLKVYLQYPEDLSETYFYGATAFQVAPVAKIPATGSIALGVLLGGLCMLAARQRSNPAAFRLKCWRPVFCFSAVAYSVMLALLPSVTEAYVGPPKIQPALPRPGEQIFVAVETRGCHILFDAVDGDRFVERVGSRIDVTAEGFEGAGAPCLFFQSVEHRIPIGALPAGVYELHFHFYESGGAPETFETGSITFSVAAPQAIPATAAASGAAAIATLLLVGLLVLRFRNGT